MALRPKLSDSAANAEASAFSPLLNSGYFRIYDGVQPADANTPITTQRMLAELRFGNPAFGDPVGGVITAKPITPASSATATGTASWFRWFESDGATVVLDGSVGTSGCNLNMSSTGIQQGAEVSVSGFTHTVTE